MTGSALDQSLPTWNTAVNQIANSSETYAPPPVSQAPGTHHTSLPYFVLTHSMGFCGGRVGVASFDSPYLMNLLPHTGKLAWITCSLTYSADACIRILRQWTTS
jgi:hypothetical protein